MQRLQVIVQNRVLRPALRGAPATTLSLRLPLPLRALIRFPALRAIPARVVGLGFRPEHVRTPDVLAAAPERDVAGVVTAPPLLYLGALVASLCVERRMTHSRLPAVSRFVGAALGCAAASVGAPAFGAMRGAGTNVDPYRPSTALVEGGPFAFTRNPLYLSMTLLYAGISLGARATFPLCVLPAVLWVVNRGVVEREERYLARKFPSDYARYRARVPRWL